MKMARKQKFFNHLILKKVGIGFYTDSDKSHMSSLTTKKSRQRLLKNIPSYLAPPLKFQQLL